MKALTFALTLLAATTVTSAFAEGGSDRLKERSDQWAMQRQQQQQEAVAKRDAQPAPQTQGSTERPAS
ncbi:hypothetical protein ACQKPE_08600 [Pseudomonas sp. NPDC089554]|uniref:hypothetical protein n=1 Tax=Pseudomonas sp. NPDC089554 TaxID=3390653 RepID=UPI003CFBF44D